MEQDGKKQSKKTKTPSRHPFLLPWLIFTPSFPTPLPLAPPSAAEEMGYSRSITAPLCGSFLLTLQCEYLLRHGSSMSCIEDVCYAVLLSLGCREMLVLVPGAPPLLLILTLVFLLLFLTFPPFHLSVSALSTLV